METVKLTYEIDGENFSAAGEASTAVKRVLKKLKLPPAIVRRAVVCMYEGEINMVIHADGGEALLEVDEEKIQIVLKDRGPGIPDIDKAMEEGWSTASSSVRAMGFGAGMGLPNMKRNADHMDIDTTLGVGTTVTMTIYIGGEPQ
jgi:anti-sigma regulatory factor (Ser/Thr protein kinase)